MKKSLKNIPVNVVETSVDDVEFEYSDEDDEDADLIRLVEERLANDTGIRYTWEEMLEASDITQEELDAMEDVEIE